MKQKQEYPLVVIVEHCILNNETYEYLLQTEKPYMLMNGSTLCNMPLDLRWCRSEWFRICRDVSVECKCPVVSCCGMTPDVIRKYATGWSKIIVLCLTSDEETFDKKIMDSDIYSSEIRESRKVHFRWFRKNQLEQYSKDEVLDVSGLGSEEEARVIDGWIRKKLAE